MNINVKDTMNVWYDHKSKQYNIRYGGTINRCSSYIEAKACVDRVMQSYMFNAVAMGGKDA